MEIAENLLDTVLCGNIILKKLTWEISFVCNFCKKTQSTLPDLLRHALSEHVEGITADKLEELCAHEKPIEIFDSESDDSDHELPHNDKQKEMNDEVLINEDIVNASTIPPNIIERQDDEKTSTLNKMNDSDGDEEPSNMRFEFLDVDNENQKAETKLTPKSKRVCKITTLLQCDTCNEKFPSYARFAVHKRKVHGEKPFICTECGAGFTERGSLSLHRLRHKGIKPHACEVCQKTFTTRTEVMLHMRRHTGERPYKCSYCDKTLISSSSLYSHERLHTKERPYLCPNCGKTFTSSTGLDNHIVIHSTEKPFKCTKCDSSFANRKRLQQHIQIHSEVKKYKCQDCGKAFAQFSGLHSHQKSVHKAKTKNKGEKVNDVEKYSEAS